MKTKLFTTILFLFLVAFSFAQDTIYKTNGSKIVAKVTEINSTSIKYKFVNNGGELVAEASKSEIAYVVYAGGLKEIYNPIVNKKETATTVTAAELPAEDAPKQMKVMNNIIAINCFDIFFTNLNLSYERFSKSGSVSIKIPLSVGLGGKPNENNYTSTFGGSQFLQNRQYSVGVELNAYPFGRTKNTFYVGVSGVAGSFAYYKDVLGANYQNGYYYNSIVGHEKHIGTHFAGMLHLGGYIGLSDNILMGAKVGLGFKREETIELDYTLPKAQLDLNLAYRF